MFKEYMPFLLTLVDFRDLEMTKDLTFYKVLKATRETLDLKGLLARKVIKVILDYKVNKDR
jgi:hypothetical protein